MSRKPIVIAGIVAASIGVIAAIGIGVFALTNIASVAPLEVEQPAAVEPPAVDVEAEGDVEPVVLRSGMFVDADAIHRGSGTVSVVDDGEQLLLVFGDDVRSRQAPTSLSTFRRMRLAVTSVRSFPSER